MAFNVTVTPIVQEVEVNASVTPYEVNVSVIDSELTLTTVGTSGNATFDPFTGVLNIPNYTTDLSGVVPNSRTLTINGTAYDLSTNRSWTVGDLLSSGSYSNPSWLTSLAWSKISGTPTTLSGYGITDAQATLSLTTTGSSGASTLVGATLNIPNYTLSGLGGIGGTLATGQVAFGSGTNTVAGDSNFTYNNLTGSLSLSSKSTGSASFFTLNDINNASIFSITANGTITGLIASFGNTTVNLLTSTSSVQVGFSSFIRFGASGGSGRSIISSPSNGTLVLENNARTGFSRLFFGGTTSSFPSIKVVSSAIHFVNGDDTSTIQLVANSLLLNTTTDSGFRLDVNGTARVQGNTTITGNLTVDTNTLFVDSTNDRVGIGTTSPNQTFTVNGRSLFTRDAGVTSANHPIVEFYRFSSGTNNAGFGVFYQADGSNPIRTLLYAPGGLNFALTTFDGVGVSTNLTCFASTTNVGIGSTTDQSSAILHLTSTTKGFLPPRMTSAQRDAIASPATGLVVYNTSTNKHQGYNGTTWNDFY